MKSEIGVVMKAYPASFYYVVAFGKSEVRSPRSEGKSSKTKYRSKSAITYY